MRDLVDYVVAIIANGVLETCLASRLHADLEPLRVWLGERAQRLAEHAVSAADEAVDREALVARLTLDVQARIPSSISLVRLIPMLRGLHEWGFHLSLAGPQVLEGCQEAATAATEAQCVAALSALAPPDWPDPVMGTAAALAASLAQTACARRFLEEVRSGRHQQALIVLLLRRCQSVRYPAWCVREWRPPSGGPPALRSSSTSCGVRQEFSTAPRIRAAQKLKM